MKADEPIARPSVNDCVDAVYVLTVKTFTQRIAHVRQEMARHGIHFEFMFDHDASELDDALIQATFAPSDMKRGHQSLVLKNVAVWRDAIRKGYQRILVFEDDAVLLEHFNHELARAMAAADHLPPGWLVFLGGLDTKVPPHYFLSEGPLVEVPIATTEAYVCDRLAIERRLAWIAEHRIALAVDHLIRQVDKACGTRQYWLTQPIVEQGSVLGIFDSVLDGQRNKHSRWFNILRNRWNKFQRRRLRGWVIRLKARLGMRLT